MSMFELKLKIVLTICLLLPLPVSAADCFDCHDPGKFKGLIVHPPVAMRQCAACHSPHVSKYAGLLLQKEAQLCYSCHPQVANQVEASAVPHQPVKEGLCSVCHAPHASSNSGLLKEGGSALCYSCHKSSKQNYSFAHKPFQEGKCSACHSAHAGDDYRLLKKTGSALCFDCHQPGSALTSTHLGRDLRQIDCLSCHNPHGGHDRSLLRAVSHQPFAQRNCNVCHSKAAGIDMCLGCHPKTLISFNKVHTHIGAGGSVNACTACHNPHVGDRAGLLPANEGMVCRSCHADTFAKREKMLHKHPAWNVCSACHYGHGGDNPAMLIDGQNVCARCHNLHSNFTHPQGKTVIDPRNGRQMDCLTCHDADAGTMYKHFLHGSGERGLCVQCHQSY